MRQTLHDVSSTDGGLLPLDTEQLQRLISFFEVLAEIDAANTTSMTASTSATAASRHNLNASITQDPTSSRTMPPKEQTS
jgi:hypothetical protein